MARRQRLSDDQVRGLFDPPTDQRALVRYYTLSNDDLAVIHRCRGDHNKLGLALMRCYLHHPGRAMRAGERPPEALLNFVAAQLGLVPGMVDEYIVGDRNRQRHAIENQAQLGLRPYGRLAASGLLAELLPHAIENDRLAYLAELVMETCRERKIMVPSPGGLERICGELRTRARNEVHRRLSEGLTALQRQRLDALTERRDTSGQNWLTWLRQMPQAAKTAGMLGVIERLNHVRAIGIEPGRGHLVHQTRMAQLAREAGRTTVQHVAGFEKHRRHASLLAASLELSANLTDQAIQVFDRMVSALFRKVEAKEARSFQADARAINDKVRLYAKIGAALIVAQNDNSDPFAAITGVISWERFEASVAEAKALARPEELGVYQKLGDHSTTVRRWSPAFLAALSFESVPAAASLMRAIDLLRDLNRRHAATLPKEVPIGFVRGRWRQLVLSDGTINRRFYELCVLTELRDRLRAGDVWVVGSRQCRSFEERLVATDVFEDMKAAATLPVAVDPDFDSFIADRRARLDHRLAEVDERAKDGLLPDVTITQGVLKVAPLGTTTPIEAELLAERLYAMLPRIRVTDLLAEVASWTMFPDCFTHLRTGEVARDNRVLMAGVLADGLNLGLTRMAESTRIASLGQLAWTSDWHIRDETYALALRCIVNQQQREAFSAVFGGGRVSSSDGQFFRAGGFGSDAGSLNAHYDKKPGYKIYTHLSDRYAPFFTKLIAATSSEALHVLDALLYHQSDIAIDRHHTDGGGDSELVFALCALLGFQFAPRIPDLKHRRLYSFEKASLYPTLEPMIAGRINVELIRIHWNEILRIVASIRTGTVTASAIMRQLAAHPRQNGIAAALRELGRMERTLFTLDWIDDPELRRSAGQELNKGESRNSLARAVFIHRLGEIRDRTYENQQHRASGLNLVVTAIILWNTRYLERAVAALLEIEDVPQNLLAFLSPLGWEHVNLTGDYIWGTDSNVTENTDGLKSLRTPPQVFKKAA